VTEIPAKYQLTPLDLYLYIEEEIILKLQRQECHVFSNWFIFATTPL
jgi:hypothetical protein